ncbi:MAG: hypothetical protein AAGU27_01265 [Dehalobacterium sp.]
MKEKDLIRNFFQKYEMDFDKIDFKEQCEIFLSEMERGLAGDAGSLAMIPTYIGVVDEIPLEEPIIVLDAGGTNLRVATIYFNRDGQPVMENFQKRPMPGTYGEMTKDVFFHTLASSLDSQIHNASRIGFCFSYPTEIMPDKDGRLICFTKEIKVKDVEGELIGKNLSWALKDRGCKDEKRIILLNDTVATLLAGKAALTGRLFDTYLGFILGTGTNACYIEENAKITKLTGLSPLNRMIINVEWGSYDKAPRSQIDVELDQTFHDPGYYIFEKMIAGAYLGKLALAFLCQAADEGIFSAGFTEEVKKVLILNTKDLNDFLHYPSSIKNPLTPCLNAGSRQDRISVYWIIDGILERAALLTAINLAALILKTEKGFDPCRPVSIAVEGTTFFALKGLRGKIEYYLKKYLGAEMGLNFEFVGVEHSSLIGAAIAGLTN